MNTNNENNPQPAGDRESHWPLAAASIIVLAIIAVALISLSVPSGSKTMTPSSSWTPAPGTPPATPEQVALTGTYACLPHKASSGPQTLECAIGLQASDGSFYALDLSALKDSDAQALASNTRVSVVGFLIPIIRLNTDQW